MCDPGQETSHRDAGLLVHKAGPNRAALAKLLVVLRFEAPFTSGEGCNTGIKMADSEMGSGSDEANHSKLFY